MIPQFPEFKKLELADKAEVESFTKKFPPYSDFNFVSIWSWDVKGEMRLAWLNGNLVVRFSHYLTEDSFLSFIGENEVDKTISQLLEYSKATPGLLPELKFVPELVVEKMESQEFAKEEEPEQFDYIYDMKVLAELSGGHFASKRTAMNKLMRDCPTIEVRMLDISDDHTKFEIKKVNIAWMRYKAKKDPYDEVRNELIAIDRFLSGPFSDNILTLGVFVNDQIVAYHLAEKVRDDYAVCHYVKADFSHTGIYDYLMRETAKTLLGQGVKYLNFEQDLGLEGLKKSKERFSTGVFLKKYKVVVK
jgi:hypothetical protein